MKKYFHIKQHKIPLYNGYLIILLTNDLTKTYKQVPHFNSETLYAHAYFDKYKSHKGHYIILNFHTNYGTITHGAIAHEAHHIANFIAENRGINADFDNDEPTAYLIDWITTQTYKFIKKQKFKVEI